jgi:hypothetical protein
VFYNLAIKDLLGMQFAILSDIHGNLPALQAVLNDLDPVQLDGFILAGDYTGCPQAVETIQLLHGLKGWIPDDIWEKAGGNFDWGEAEAWIAR